MGWAGVANAGLDDGIGLTGAGVGGGLNIAAALRISPVSGPDIIIEGTKLNTFVMSKQKST
jgi:hypothetical protein